MATWNGVITNAGNSLLNEWVNEKALNFDSAAAGQGTVAAAAMMAQTALVNEKQTASLLGGERVSSGIRLKLRIAAPNTAYTLNQFRVSASVDGGASAMIALFQLEQGVPIPSKTESPDFVYTFYALISCSNTGTWTVTVNTSACVTQSDMSAAITEAVKTKQDKIMVKGLLLGDGNGNISAAVAGKDYGYPLATGSGAPTDTTEGTAGQHYYDSATGKEYVCSGKDSSGKYQWKLSGASDAADLTYNGESLDTFLDGVSGDLDTLSEGLDGSKPLTGKTDPTSSTKGSVGQSYLNTDTMQTFYCTAANDQTGVYTWEKPKGGGVAPQLEVSVATGSAITCTNGETTLTGTSVGGKCVFDLPGYGTWSLYATLNGQTTATETVVVDQVKQYAVTLSYFAATLTVTAESGAVVTATLGTKQYTGTCGSNGKCALTVNYAGTYSVTATKSGVSSSTASAAVSTSGGSYTTTVKFCTLTVTIDSGSAVKAVNGSTTLTATSNGTAKFYLPNTGTWSVTATKNGETATGNVACSSYTGYTLELSYVKVFGVCWNYNAQSTALTRLKKSTDPNGLVNVDITTNPAPAVGTGAGSSPFDNYLPWSGMDEYNIINNAVSYKKGQSGFSRSSYDRADRRTRRRGDPSCRGLCVPAATLARRRTPRSSCGPPLSSRHWQRPAPRASKIYSCSIVLLDTFVCFGIISTVIAFSHDFIIAVETHQPESDAVAIPSEVHVLPLKLFPANRASQLRHIFQCPIFAHISTSHISVRYCASDSRHPARRDIRPCCPARPLIESFAVPASTLCRTSARRHASHSLPPSSMRQFSGAATIAHAVSGVMLSIMSSKASCIPQASQI